MRTIKFYLLLIAVLLFVSCKSFKGYTINGTIKNGENVSVYLEDLTSNELTVIDTTTIVNGKFQLKNYAAKGLYRLRFGDQEALFLYINEKDKIDITADLKDILNYSVSGSKDCQVIKEFVSEINKQIKEQDAIYATVQQAEGLAKDSLMNLLDEEQKNYIGYIKQFVGAAENKEIAAFALNFLGPALQQEIPYLVAITDSLHKADPGSKFIERWYTSVQQYRESLLANETKGIAIGALAPDIILRNPDGDSIQLKDLRGKYVLLDFWASWCGPCRRDNPNVVRLYKQFHPKGLEIFSVSLDTGKSPWVSAIQKDGLIWPHHGSDLGGWNSKPAQDYRVESIPQTYLLDQQGVVIAKNLRGEMLEQKLQEIFSQSPIGIQ